MNLNALNGVINYQKLLLLKELKAKYEPKPENVRYVLLNDSPQMSKEELAGEIKYRLNKSSYSVNNILKAIDMLSQARSGMDVYEKYITDAKSFISKFKSLPAETVLQIYSDWLKKIKRLVDSTRIKYLRLLTTEDFKKDMQFRKKVRARSDFRKRFDAKLNPALMFNKIIIHTAISEEPFLQINIPVELGYKTYRLEEIDLSENQGKVELVEKINELEQLVIKEKENSDSYIEKLKKIYERITIYQQNLEATLNASELNKVNSVLNENVEMEDKLNFSVVTKKAKTGMIFNFVT